MKAPNDMIWFDRLFDFDLPVEMFPMVVERLRETPARLEEKIRGLSNDILTKRDGDVWSIQEQVGHLMDLYELWDGRITDFLEGEERLRPADITNRVTKHANHNAASIDQLLKSFRTNRESLVKRFEQFDLKGAAMTAQHPRLDQSMRVIDLAFFIAEHDDHHLARMTDLIELFS
jgi:uncharacterized damage-inducible protein DinB